MSTKKTATCYKQTTVIMETTKEPPIFLGPIFIHDNSDFDSFSNFFNHLRTKLIQIDTTNLVFGTDEELALVNAIKYAFPDYGHILCMRHLRQNVKQKLVDDCIDKTDRNSILDDIFGDNGLLNAEDAMCFDIKLSEIDEKSKQISTKFQRYLDKKLQHNLRDIWTGPQPTGHFDKNWTNNNCESLNHVLKCAVDWKSKPRLDLVTIISDIMDV